MGWWPGCRSHHDGGAWALRVNLVLCLLLDTGIFTGREISLAICLGIFSPNGVPTVKGSYGKNKGRCLIRVPTLGPSLFPVNFPVNWLLWNVDLHFGCTGSRKVYVYVSAFWAQSGPRHFSCKFPYKVALVKCWGACRLRRLAQSVRLGSGPRHFPVNFKNYHIKWLLWNADLHFDCAGSHKVCVCVLGSIWTAAFFL